MLALKNWDGTQRLQVLPKVLLVAKELKVISVLFAFKLWILMDSLKPSETETLPWKRAVFDSYVVHQRKMFSCHFDKNLSMSCYTIRSLQKLAVIFSGRINHRLLEPNRNTSNVAKHHHLSLVTWFSFVKNEGKRIRFHFKYLLKLLSEASTQLETNFK